MERKFFNSALFIGTLSILGVMVFSPHLIYAQTDEIIDPSILPDSPFYGIKLAIENIQEAFTFQEERRAELLLKHSEERDREAVALERQGKMIPIDRLKAIQAEKIRNAEIIIQRLERAQNIIDETERQVEERRELAQATTEEERIAIQMQQRAQDRTSNIIEPRTDMGLLEPETLRESDRPVTIVPVTDIDDDDDQSEIISKLRARLENSFSTSEITEIRASFAEIRGETDPARQELLADQLDAQVNNPLVSITCFGAVSTLSIAQADDPVKELQEQCPILRPLPTEELRKVANGLG